MVNIVSGRTAQKRVTGGQWRRIVLGDVLAEHLVRVEQVVRSVFLRTPHGRQRELERKDGTNRNPVNDRVTTSLYRRCIVR